MAIDSYLYLNGPFHKDYKIFDAQRCQARRRKIEFVLSFDEWYDWWQATGHYHERGCKKGQYVMSRFDDCGAYQIGNIECKLHSINCREGIARAKAHGTFGKNIGNRSIKNKSSSK